MSNINEIIIPNVPELSLSMNTVDINADFTALRGRHFHKEFEIFRVDEGSMQLITDNSIQQVSAGDIIFINSYFIHEIRALSKHCKATYFQIDLQPYINSFFNTEDSFLYHYINTLYSEKFKVFSFDRISDIIDCIENELNEKLEFYDIQIKAYVYQLIVYLYRYNFIVSHKQISQKSTQKLLPAINYINDNTEKKIFLDELCALLHIDKYYFCKLFKQTTGSTPTEYINFIRLHKAEQLLISEKMSISEIALACGFSSTQYFNKLFKKYHGFTPTYYKKLFSKS